MNQFEMEVVGNELKIKSRFADREGQTTAGERRNMTELEIAQHRAVMLSEALTECMDVLLDISERTQNTEIKPRIKFVLNNAGNALDAETEQVMKWSARDASNAVAYVLQAIRRDRDDILAKHGDKSGVNAVYQLIETTVLLGMPDDEIRQKYAVGMPGMQT